MDINYLLAREQVSLIHAHSASGIEARRAHAALALAYGARLAAGTYPHRRPLPVPANDVGSNRA